MLHMIVIYQQLAESSYIWGSHGTGKKALQLHKSIMHCIAKESI